MYKKQFWDDNLRIIFPKESPQSSCMMLFLCCWRTIFGHRKTYRRHFCVIKSPSPHLSPYILPDKGYVESIILYFLISIKSGFKSSAERKICAWKSKYLTWIFVSLCSLREKSSGKPPKLESNVLLLTDILVREVNNRGGLRYQGRAIYLW